MKQLGYFMMRWAVLLCLLLLGSTEACKKEESSEREERPKEEEKEPSVYLTGIGFPQGFDWRRGTYEEVDTYLIVLKDGKKYLNLPVGEAYYISPDPDMHRIIGGQLYADFSTSDQTIITKNGVELFRYEGREMMSGFLVKGKDVYTLGADRSGRGLSFRKNGRLLFEDPLGTPSGEMGKCLYEDEGRICFSFRKKVNSLPPEFWEWYICSDGHVEKVQPEEGVLRIYDARKVNGKICTISSFRKNELLPVLVYDGEVQPVCKGLTRAGISRSQLVYSEDQLYVKTWFGRGTEARLVVWNQNKKEVVYDDSLPVYDFYFEGDACRFLVFTRNKIMVYDLEDQGQVIQGNYQIVGRDCASLEQDRMRIALTPCDYKEIPVLWTDGQLEPLPFTGYVTSVVVDRR